jgi:hypothetical protein
MVLFDRVENVPEPQHQIAFDLLPGLQEVFERTSRIAFFGEDARALANTYFQGFTEDVYHQQMEHTDAELLGDSVLSLPAFKTDFIFDGFDAEYKTKLSEYIAQHGPIVTHHKTCTLIAKKGTFTR